ncbi:MAG: choice-of-anchor B family protein, partial [Gemmatimonadetes bacterium]|nr:choice-of-anchor B family protein [Gemmatimonadota bacterium]
MLRPRLHAACASILSLALLTPGLMSAQQFGGPLAISGNQLLIGEGGNQTLSGLVYVFGEVDGTWSEVDQLQVTDELRQPDGFGRALDAEGDQLLVGAPIEGAAYFFRRTSGGDWVQEQALLGTEGGRFGSAVALAGDLALVSAPQEGPGAVHMFQRGADGLWSPAGQIDSPNQAGNGFGGLMATDGDHLLVTAAGAGRGAAAPVYAFRLEGMESLGELQATDLGDRSQYGAAVAVRDGTAYVGAPGVDNRVGSVFSFDLRGDAPEPQGRLGPIYVAVGASFGSSITATDSQLLIGAPGTGGTGALYAIEDDESVRIVTSPTAPRGASFGSSVALAEGLAIVGAVGVDERQGAVVVFDGAWDELGTVVNEARGFASITGDEIHCVEGQAALFECRDVNITAFVPIAEIGGARGTRVNDIWGWTDPETGIEYAIVGRTNGTSFVDISDPYQPVYVGDLPATPGSRIAIWRDMKVYENHVYVVADGAGEHGVQVLDLTRLREFQGQPITFDETFHYDGIHSAHNIVINEETGFAYTVGNSGGGETCGGGLHILNLSTPSRPVFDGCFADPETGRRGTGYSHDAQCVIYEGPDEEHRGKEICLGSNETALSIADVSDKDAPITISSASYPK